ncbi:FadR/GntR family transcriptional regulator [Noviherbaspirillum saxi]|uniref:FadR family transcriptional regulator n=1 Tax=Noviherbaspirillum saxi TaxID=2320863 RepID=A0A3A3FG18_9BURK|nr:FadR/GntR family transcriptional regulator [Noviherbaspirillum saxi]RJF92311.1 FadR family transcriptional regulator [Noviherbaspirillum saxi]
MPIQIVEAPRLYRQIADQLRMLIRDNEFKPGSKLPTERDLAHQLGVSRPPVREALIALEVEGWIEVRKGSGVYVCDRQVERAIQPELFTEMHGPLELIRARMVVEGEIAALAARLIRKPQVERLEEAIDLMQSEADAGSTPVGADRMFHLRLASIAGNSALTSVVALLFDERDSPISARLGEHLENESGWNAAIREHRQIVDAVASHDPAKARAAMQKHMIRAHRRFTMRID